MSRADRLVIRAVQEVLAGEGWLPEREIRLRTGMGAGAVREALWAMQRQGRLHRRSAPGRARPVIHYALAAA